MTPKPEERHAQLELCIPYVFGRLNPGNRKQFEAHLAAGCDLCNKELSELYEATALLPLLLRQETPPSGLRQRLLNRLSSKKSEPPQHQRAERSTAPQKPVSPALRAETPWYRYASAVIGILIIVALLIFVYQLVGTATDQEKTIASLQAQVQQQSEMLNVLKEPNLEIVSLAAADPASASFGRIVWDPVKRDALIQVAQLPALQNGQDYQVWVLKAKTYFSAGVFDLPMGESGAVVKMTLPVGDRNEIEGFAVTAEQKGGSSQPSVPLILRGVTR